MGLSRVGEGTAVAVKDRMTSTLRVPCDLPVEWERSWKSVVAHARAIDENGFFLTTAHRVRVGTVLELVVLLPFEHVPLRGIARAIGAGRWGRGIDVEIATIDRAQRERWIAYYRAERDAMPAILRRLLLGQEAVTCTRSFPFSRDTVTCHGRQQTSQSSM
jgi:hypothetical protein